MKRIILLSDGTGNSSAKLFKTNVWRLYQALDLTGSDPGAIQVACYNDGIGTSSFKPLAIIGGVFGWGLKRNVLHLYEYLCRNWQPGDEIHAFGFSRGAFTVRVLAGLIASQGIVRAEVGGGARPGGPRRLPRQPPPLQSHRRPGERAADLRDQAVRLEAPPAAAEAELPGRARRRAEGCGSPSSASGTRWRPMARRSPS